MMHDRTLLCAVRVPADGRVSRKNVITSEIIITMILLLCETDRPESLLRRRSPRTQKYAAEFIFFKSGSINEITSNYELNQKLS